MFAFVREPTIAFRPPENPHVPMIMIGAGTGMAPFRGFLQERAALRDQGVPVAPSLLFFGCRNHETDLLYADEMREYEEQGLVRVENAFSRGPDGRCRYVQDAMLDCADEVWDLLQQEAAVFVCGNASTIAPGVRASLTAIFRDRTGAGEADAQRGWPGCAPPTGSWRTSGAADPPRATIGEGTCDDRDLDRRARTGRRPADRRADRHRRVRRLVLLPPVRLTERLRRAARPRQRRPLPDPRRSARSRPSSSTSRTPPS